MLRWIFMEGNATEWTKNIWPTLRRQTAKTSKKEKKERFKQALYNMIAVLFFRFFVVFLSWDFRNESPCVSSSFQSMSERSNFYAVSTWFSSLFLSLSFSLSVVLLSSIHTAIPLCAIPPFLTRTTEQTSEKGSNSFVKHFYDVVSTVCLCQHEPSAARVCFRRGDWGLRLTLERE